MKIGFWRGIFNDGRTFEQAGDGGAGGGQGGDGQQQQQRGGGQQQQQQRGSGGDGQQKQTASAFKLAPDALVETEDGRQIKYSDYQKELRSQIDGDYRGRYKSAYDLLVKEAQKIDAMSRGGRQPQQQQQQDDPLAALDLENQPLVDGKTAAQLVKILRDTGLAPIGNLVASLQKQVGDMAKQLKGTQSHIGTFNEERANHEFEANLTGVIKGLQVKGLEDRTIDPNNESLREFARNLYLSYDVQSWKPGEFQKMLGEQLSGIVQYMRTLDKEYANTASDRLKKHFAPQRGQGAGSGKQPYQFKSARQIAAEAREAGVFGGQRT